MCCIVVTTHRVVDQIIYFLVIISVISQTESLKVARQQVIKMVLGQSLNEIHM